MNYLNNIMPYILAYVAVKAFILWYMLSKCDGAQADDDNTEDKSSWEK